MACVDALYRYPVKSMAGERCDSLQLEPRGVESDRLWAVRTADGKLGSGKSTRRFRRIDGLLEHASSLSDGRPQVTLPDGRIFDVGDPRLDDALSDALGRRLEVRREAEVRHFDEGAVHLLAASALDDLRTQLPGARIAVERFRPNIVVGSGGPAPFERIPLGARLRVGREVVLRVTSAAERCRMVGLAQGALPEDRTILEHLARTTGATFGLYAEVVQSGGIAVGDVVERLVV